MAPRKKLKKNPEGSKLDLALKDLHSAFDSIRKAKGTYGYTEHAKNKLDTIALHIAKAGVKLEELLGIRE